MRGEGRGRRRKEGGGGFGVEGRERGSRVEGGEDPGRGGGGSQPTGQVSSMNRTLLCCLLAHYNRTKLTTVSY